MKDDDDGDGDEDANEANEEDLRQAFRMFVERKSLPPMRDVNSHQYASRDTSSITTASGGYMNAMQFSHIWRRLTGESSNLYREIQVGAYV